MISMGEKSGDQLEPNYSPAGHGITPVSHKRATAPMPMAKTTRRIRQSTFGVLRNPPSLIDFMTISSVSGRETSARMNETAPPN